MFTLTKINVMWEWLTKLTKKVDSLDVEIPDHGAGDAGKYLGVDSSGDLEFSDPLPATSGASTGDVLGLVGENKVKGWITPYTPRDYSTTETNTGVKWIDGSDIYQIVFTGVTPKSDENYISLPLIYDKIITFFGTYLFSNQNYRDLNRVFQISSINAKTAIYLYKGPDSTTYEIPFTLIVYYTKPASSKSPEDEEPETKVTKKKTTK